MSIIVTTVIAACHGARSFLGGSHDQAVAGPELEIPWSPRADCRTNVTYFI